MRTNIRLISFPIILCLLLVLLQVLFDRLVNNSDDFKCGCICVRRNGNKCVEEKCGIEYSDPDQAQSCYIPQPPQWPPILQVPAAEYRAVRNDFITYPDLPNAACRINNSCPAIIFLTGSNRSFGESMPLPLDSLFCISYSFLNLIVSPNDL